MLDPDSTQNLRSQQKCIENWEQTKELGSWEAVGRFEGENKVCKNYFVYPVKCEFE